MAKVLITFPNGHRHVSQRMLVCDAHKFAIRMESIYPNARIITKPSVMARA